VSEWSPGIQRVLDHVEATNGWYFVLSDVLKRRMIRRPAPGVPAGRMCPGFSAGWPMSSYEAQELATAADGWDNADPALRAALLRAAGLA
jgi:hypothetical protein